MAILLTHALLVDFDPPQVAAGSLRIDQGRIVARHANSGPEAGAGPRAADGDEVVDCGGAVVMPGLVNGHTHLYAALATGMPPPTRTPANFPEILKYVWWRLDRALDAESIELSARVGALAALRCGTTTLIDHHASPNCIAGALDLVETGLADVGLRGVLCYETTDRHGPEGSAAGLDENRRYLQKCRARPPGRFAGLVGAHASFTLEDDTLAKLAGLAEQFDCGVHIHVAEDPCDELDARRRSEAAQAGKRNPTVTGLIERLDRCFLIQPDAVLAHCTHLPPPAIARVNEMGAYVAHNPRSNMNNAVGYAPVGAFASPVMLGTDGIGADMLAEAQAAWMIGRHARAERPPAPAQRDAPTHRRPAPGRPGPVRSAPADVPETPPLAADAVVQMLANAARRASRALGVTLGRLEPGAAADIVLTDYAPVTPLAGDNLAGHVLFGMSAGMVRDVLIGGQWALRNRVAQRCDEPTLRAAARDAARALWERIAALPN